ncbi:hypothetical protein MLD38_010386 [Melastoma candidum]|uniref:Uncharacterized protein n=1 Tax=Melastoma candidum TaxID=119954 RepID=A0ACB9R3R6_9MYRT|nr:hypothetical protein MLD38_010386 [Melastoma candidum]
MAEGSSSLCLGEMWVIKFVVDGLDVPLTRLVGAWRRRREIFTVSFGGRLVYEVTISQTFCGLRPKVEFVRILWPEVRYIVIRRIYDSLVKYTEGREYIS